jgi:hypothetical protein
VCSQHAKGGGHLTRGHSEARSKPCPQRAVADAETEKAGLERHPDGGESEGVGHPLRD